MAEDIPIDIHYNKLLDWLVNRRHCDSSWQSKILAVRQKINNAIQDMPEHPEITQLLSGTFINYFHCVRIVEILKDTEAATKNIFGRYSSQRMKDWQEVVKMYEKDGLYLAEAAQLLTRNANYDIPSLKRQIGKSQQLQQDCIKKEGEYASNSAEFLDKYHDHCKQMGIEGRKLKSEILALVKNLPSVYDSVATAVRNIHDALQLYSEFLKFTLGKKGVDDESLDMIQIIYSKGNITTYEWRTGKPPSSIESDMCKFSEFEDKEERNEDELIDWGQIDFDNSNTDGITLDIDEGNQDQAMGGIDWGNLSAEIEVVDQSVEIAADIDTDVVHSSVVDDDTVARGTDALTLLDNIVTREQFIDQLIELHAFLTQRLKDMYREKDDVLSTSLFQNAPPVLQVQAAQVEIMKEGVGNILEQLTSAKMQNLMHIRNSPVYVDRLADKLKKIKEDSEKLMSLSRLMVVRRDEAAVEERDLNPKLDLIRQRMKELQKQIEQEISEKYKHRIVNIVGDINTI